MLTKIRGTNIRIILPMPPSLNGSFYNSKNRGRVKTYKYRDWQRVAGLMLARYKSKSLPQGPYAARIELPLDRRSDIDNRIKPVLDALVRAGLTPDDCWCDKVTAERTATGTGDVTVSVWALEEVSK